MLSWIINRLQRIYCAYRLRGAFIDQRYWADEVERCQANAGVANQRIDYWRNRVQEARYPVRGPRGWRRMRVSSSLLAGMRSDM